MHTYNIAHNNIVEAFIFLPILFPAQIYIHISNHCYYTFAVLFLPIYITKKIVYHCETIKSTLYKWHHSVHIL